ncbi:MAG: TlpA family protein disulfide reductase [Planctomycetota bacterium]
MRVALLLGLLGMLGGCVTPSPSGAPRLIPGTWSAWLVSPGGSLPFELELGEGDAGWAASIINGPERIPIPVVRVEGTRIALEMPHYDSRIQARINADGTKLVGHWSKRRGPNRWTRMPFEALFGAPNPYRESPRAYLGRWSAHFSLTDDPAIAVFGEGPDNRVYGTFLTTRGDYRYLAGGVDDGRLRLTAFDGAHAFLFLAKVTDPGALTGDFWSGDQWHERWRATIDAEAELPDGFADAIWTGQSSLSDLAFPDVTGTLRALDDPAFAGRARIVQIFGSWCPNCHDAALYLTELWNRYADRGLSVLGLAFELTGDLERDTEQVRLYVERHGTPYPVLIAGLADKDKASAQVPLLDRIRAYPTTLFFHGDGRVRAIHSGFAGPATGPANQNLRRRFESIIEELLAEESAGTE